MSYYQFFATFALHSIEWAGGCQHVKLTAGWMALKNRCNRELH